jgi:hypothetical protein
MSPNWLAVPFALMSAIACVLLAVAVTLAATELCGKVWSIRVCREAERLCRVAARGDRPPTRA